MLPIDFLKKHFPNTQDWILGGLLHIGFLWLFILPIEIFQIMVRQEFVPLSLVGWVVKFPYIWGYAISFFFIPPLAEYYSISDQLGGIITVSLGLAISSPAHFIMGAFLAARNSAMNIMGILIGVINIIFSCFVTFWLVTFLFSG